MISFRRQGESEVACSLIGSETNRIYNELAENNNVCRSRSLHEPNLKQVMTLDEARELLNLELKVTKKEVKAAYRRAARLWHPDRAPAGQESIYRARMQQVNEAYQLIVQFIENYRYALVDTAGPEDLQKWWADRFYTGVWGPPPPKDQKGND
jgi:hypothetical protein